MIDLHTHTTASDGTLSPAELIDYAITKKLTAIAITDHDTIGGLLPAKAHGHTMAPHLEIISGIEFSTHTDACLSDLHILGYYIDETSQDFVAALKALIQSRDERNERMIDKLRAHGINITLDDVKEVSDKGVITRAHFAKALENLGYVKTMSKAFEKYIGNGCSCYVERSKVTPKMAIELILSCGGVPVLAHPVLYKMNLKDLSSLIGDLKKDGLLGIEGLYTTYKTHETKYIQDLATAHDLIITGGSDFHGSHKKGIDLGVGYGQLRVPDELRNILYEVHLDLKARVKK